jgi:hypothetical protein
MEIDNMVDVSEVKLSTRAANILKFESITTLEQLSTFSAAQLLRFPNFGRRTLNEVEHLLFAYGFRLKGRSPTIGKSSPRAKGAGTFWTHARMARAKAMLDAGLSSNEVARRFGKNSGPNMLAALTRYGYYGRDEKTLVQRLYRSTTNVALCQEAAAHIKELHKRAVKAETSLAVSLSENEIRRSDGNQMWKALSDKVNEKEFKLAFDAIMNSRRDALKGG